MKLSELLKVENKYGEVNKKYSFYVNNDKDLATFVLKDEETGLALSVLEFLLNTFDLKSICQDSLTSANLLNALGSADIENAGLNTDDLNMIRKGIVITKGQRMVRNIYNVYNLPSFDLTVENIINVWKQVTKFCCGNKSIKGKKFRNGNVIVGEYRPIDYKYLDIVYPSFIEEMKKEDNIILRSLLLHFGTAYYHPFCDGNGRTSRLLLNKIIIDSGLDKFRYISITSEIKKEPKRYEQELRDCEVNKDCDITTFIMYYLEVIEQVLSNLKENVYLKGIDDDVNITVEMKGLLGHLKTQHISMDIGEIYVWFNKSGIRIKKHEVVKIIETLEQMGYIRLNQNLREKRYMYNFNRI